MHNRQLEHTNTVLLMLHPMLNGGVQTLEWTGMEWTGMEWTGMEWTGMEWTTGMAKKIKFPGSTGLIGHVLEIEEPIRYSEA